MTKIDGFLQNFFVWCTLYAFHKKEAKRPACRQIF